MTIYATTKGHQHKYVIYSQFKVNHLKSMKQLCAGENLVLFSKLAQLWFPGKKHFAIYTLVNIGGVSVQHFVLRMRSCLLNKREKNWASPTVCQVFCFRQSGMRSML